jgi:hypothetical protein
MELSTGSVIRLTNFNNTYPQPSKGKKVGLLSVSYKAPKDQVFVAVLLGIEPKSGDPALDLDAVMERMGWVRKEAK